jgi:hypothetical protein
MAQINPHSLYKLSYAHKIDKAFILRGEYSEW